jgi:hypothetical protein
LIFLLSLAGSWLNASSPAAVLRNLCCSRAFYSTCVREITGKTAEISEHQIGVHVFGRRPGYHPGEDNIVRNYARQLRHRLDQYFLEEGRQEELRLSIPRGKYVPVYSPYHFQERPLLVVPERETDSGVVLETLVPATPPTLPVHPARWRLHGWLPIVRPRTQQIRHTLCGRDFSTRAIRP